MWSLATFEERSDWFASLGGLFAVGKDPQRDREILDRRPRNVREKPHNSWVKRMAAGHQLLSIIFLDICLIAFLEVGGLWAKRP